MVEMTPLSISLAVVVVLLQLVKTETTGFVRIEIPKFNTPISSHAYEIKTERNIEKVDAKNKWFSEDFRICLATIVKGNGVQAEKKIWRLRSCGKFRGPDIQTNWEPGKRIQALYLPISPEKTSTHVIIFPTKNNDVTTIDDFSWDGDFPFGTFSDEHSVVLPLMFPKDDVVHEIRILPGVKALLSLHCNEMFFGPRCSVHCDPMQYPGSFTCDPQTGELACKPGWTGSQCTEKVFIDRKEASQFIRPRTKRSNSNLEDLWSGDLERDCAEENCSREEVREAIGNEELTDEYWKLHNDPNDCEPNPCHNNATASCEDLYQDYKCHCLAGYKGQNCTETDLCYYGPCFNNGVCKDDGSHVICECEEGFEGTFCETEVNLCVDDPCGKHGSCESEAGGGFLCICDAGFTGVYCGVNVDDCTGAPCLNGGECVDGDNSYQCVCEIGYHGRHCEEKTNPCNNDPCLHGGTCSEGEDGFFHCICSVHYSGATCEISNYNPCTEDPCHGHGECYLMHNNVDEVGDSQKVALCVCDVGYSGDFCEKKIPACKTVEDPCPSNATCVSLSEEYVCVCPPGFEGVYCEVECDQCEQREEIKCQTNPCKNNARCLAVNDEISCICSPGFEGELCQNKIDYCSDEPCLKGECISTTTKFICDCFEGFTGETCEEDVDECEKGNQICKNEAKCNNTVGGFECLCKAGFEGKHCEHKVNPCFSDPCKNGAECWATSDGFMCRCSFGYFGPTCEEMVNHCEDEPSPCNNGGTCEINLGNEHGVECTCGERYHGSFCEHAVPPCMAKTVDENGLTRLTERNLCGSHGKCMGLTDGFICSCDDGYTGEFCENKIRVVECNDAYCKCIDKMINFKSLFLKAQNATLCSHPIYGKGKCARDECLHAPCQAKDDLTCKYTTHCFQNQQMRDDHRSSIEIEDSTSSCSLLDLDFTESRLPPGITLSDLCNRIRSMPVMVKYENDTLLNCQRMKSENNSDLRIVAALESKTSSFNSDLVALELFLAVELLIQADPVEKAKIVSDSLIDSLKNISYSGRFARPSDVEVDIDVDTHPSKKMKNDTIIIIVASVCAFFVLLLFGGFVFWLTRRNSTRTQLGRRLDADSNANTVPSVKWSKKERKENTIHSYENPLVFGIDGMGLSTISNMDSLENGREPSNAI